MPLKIAIIGAGPAGLTLASLLTKSSVSYTIYDLRPHPPSDFLKHPSASLDLHEESGLEALEACGLTDAFKALPVETTEDQIVTDKHGAVRWEDFGGERGRPEIPRSELTNMILSTIPTECINWEHKLIALSPSTVEGKWRLQFQNQPDSDEDFDLVVGTDGAWSRIRPHLTDVRPHHSGVNCITLVIPHVTERYPELAKMAGTGTFTATGNKKGIMSQKSSIDSLRIYLMISSPSEIYPWGSSVPQTPSTPADWDIRPSEASKIQQELLSNTSLYGDWAPKLKDLVSAGFASELETGSNIWARPLYMLPIDHSWVHKRGLTLIGDAAHLMTPFAGEGVNCAMKDALELSKRIIAAAGFTEGQSDNAAAAAELDNGIKTFEEDMWTRMRPISEDTWGNLHMIFTDNAPDEFVAFFEQAFAAQGAGGA